MTTWAVVPVKPFKDGKSRLGNCMIEADRYHLNVACLNNTLSRIKETSVIDKVMVISRDYAVLEVAEQHKVHGLMEIGHRGLNQALYQVNNMLDKVNDCIMIIPTDLLFMTSDDLEKLVEIGKNPPVVVVVTDRRNDGTNALLVNPAGSIPYRYGKNSAKKHMVAAQRRGIRAVLVDIPGFSFDLDIVEDLEYLRKSGGSLPVPALNLMEEISK